MRINPYKIAQKISASHKLLDDLLYNCFDETSEQNRLVIRDILTTLDLLARDIREEADKEFENDLH